MSKKELFNYFIFSLLHGTLVGMLLFGPILWLSAKNLPYSHLVGLFVVFFISMLSTIEATMDRPGIFSLVFMKVAFLWGGALLSIFIMNNEATEQLSTYLLLSRWMTSLIIWLVYLFVIRVVIPDSWREKWGIGLEEGITNRRSSRRPPPQ